MQAKNMRVRERPGPVRGEKPDAEARLRAVMEGLSESLWEESAEELRNEIVARGLDPVEQAERTRALLSDAVASFKRHSRVVADDEQKDLLDEDRQAGPTTL